MNIKVSNVSRTIYERCRETNSHRKDEISRVFGWKRVLHTVITPLLLLKHIIIGAPTDGMSLNYWRRLSARRRMWCPMNDFITVEGDPEEGERILSRLRGVWLRPAPPEKTAFRGISVGILTQFMGARNRVGIGLSCRPARLHRLAESISFYSLEATVILFGMRGGYQ